MQLDEPAVLGRFALFQVGEQALDQFALPALLGLVGGAGRGIDQVGEGGAVGARCGTGGVAAQKVERLVADHGVEPGAQPDRSTNFAAVGLQLADDLRPDFLEQVLRVIGVEAEPRGDAVEDRIESSIVICPHVFQQVMGGLLVAAGVNVLLDNGREHSVEFVSVNAFANGGMSHGRGPSMSANSEEMSVSDAKANCKVVAVCQFESRWQVDILASWATARVFQTAGQLSMQMHYPQVVAQSC